MKFQRTRQHRRPPWPNSLGKSPSKTLSPHTKEKPIIFARFWSILQYLTITFASFILAFYWSTDPRPSTHLRDHRLHILYSTLCAAFSLMFTCSCSLQRSLDNDSISFFKQEIRPDKVRTEHAKRKRLERTMSQNVVLSSPSLS